MRRPILGFEYHPIAPFSEYEITALQSQLAKAQQKIFELEVELAYTRAKAQLLIESGATIDFVRLHQMGF